MESSPEHLRSVQKWKQVDTDCHNLHKQQQQNMSQTVLKLFEDNLIPQNVGGESYKNIFLARFPNLKPFFIIILLKVPAEYFSCDPEEVYIKH